MLAGVTILIVFALLLGVAAGFFAGFRWDNTWQDPSHLVNFLGRFFTSAGFGGAMTLAAALVAVTGVRQQIKSSALQSAETLRRSAEAASDALIHSAQETSRTLEHSAAETNKTLAHASKMASESHDRATTEAQTADWWKSFEWTTARIFSESTVSDLKMDSSLAYALGLALQARVTTEQQRAVCNALVNQISRVGGGGRGATEDEEATMMALRSYLSQSSLIKPTERRDVQNLSSTQARLLELETRVALRALAENGDVGDMSFSLEDHDESRRSREDEVVRLGSRKYAIECKILKGRRMAIPILLHSILSAQKNSEFPMIFVVQQVERPEIVDIVKRFAGLPVLLVPFGTTDVTEFLTQALPGQFKSLSLLAEHQAEWNDKRESGRGNDI